MNTIRTLRRSAGFALALGLASLTGGAATAEEPAAADADSPRHFGAAFTMTETTSFSDLVSKSEQFDGKTVHTLATVKSVCRKKGCWMVLSDPEGKASETIRVRMKDYGFFVPKDCDGQVAIVEGVFSRKMLSEQMAKHFAEDAGKDPSKEKARPELTLMASGVQLTKK